MKNLCLLFLAIFIVTTAFAQDPITLALENTTYTENLDQSQTVGNAVGQVSPVVSYAQAFTCGTTGKLVRISINAKPLNNNLTSHLTLSIFEGNQPGGVLLTSNTTSISSIGYADHDILFPDSVDVIAGNSYFLHIVYDSGVNLQWRKSTANPYAGGTSFFNNGSWLETTNDDFNFSTYIAEGQTTSTTVLSITTDEKVKIKDYLMPPNDGTANQIIQTDGGGNLSWVNPSAGAGDDLGNHTATQDLNMNSNQITNLPTPVSANQAATKQYVDALADPQDKIEDDDGNTKILVEGTPNDNIIRFITDGTEQIQVDGHQIKTLNNGESVFLGNEAGKNDDLTDNRNVMVGDSTGYNSSTGKHNVFIGHGAGKDGNNDGNIMIGFQAGKSEINNNRLHIDNQDGSKNESLIYGELDNDLLRVNASFEVLTQNTIDGIKVIGHPTNNKTNIILENNNTSGQAYELFSSGGGAPIGVGKFVLRNVTQGTNDMVMDSAGQLGIGVEDPTDVLEIGAQDDFDGISIKGGANNDNVQLKLDNNATSGKSYVIRSTGAGAGQGGGKLLFRDADAGATRMTINSQGNVGIGTLDPQSKLHIMNQMEIEDGQGNGTILMTSSGNNSQILMTNSSTDDKISLFSDFGGIGSHIRMEADGTVNAIPISMYANYLNSGYGRIITDEIQINGGSDIAEMFTVNGQHINPGYLVSIDENNIGQLRVTGKKYDNKIVGIISGANGIRPGMMMGQTGTIADGELPVALSGRVYAFASNENGKIKPGDRLTSTADGKVMKAKRNKAGTIIGKSMSAMNEHGMVLVLISLQ